MHPAFSSLARGFLQVIVRRRMASFIHAACESCWQSPRTPWLNPRQESKRPNSSLQPIQRSKICSEIVDAGTRHLLRPEAVIYLAIASGNHSPSCTMHCLRARDFLLWRSRDNQCVSNRGSRPCNQQRSPAQQSSLGTSTSTAKVIASTMMDGCVPVAFIYEGHGFLSALLKRQQN